MNATLENPLCREVDEALVDVLDGTADAALFDHIAECDACRDKKHDAERAAALVAQAGADFRAPEDFAARLVAGLDARASGPVASATATERDAGASDRGIVSTDRSTEIVDPNANTVAMPSADGDSLRAVGVTPAPSTDPSPQRVDVTLPEAAALVPTPVVRSAPVAAKAAPVVSTTGSVRARGMRRSIFFASAGVAVAAAAAFGFYLKGRPHHADAPDPRAPWSGSVAAVSRAAADTNGGFEACDAKGACSPIAKGQNLAAGMTLKTDARTRVRVELADGTEIALDRGTELELGATKARAATLKHGSVVADVAHLEGSTAHLLFPGGDVEVVGTKLSLTASDDRASVEVARGEVRISTGAAKPVSVRAGEEATILKGGEAMVASSSSIADTMEWSDRSAEEVDAPVLRGLGELRARKPGDTKEKDRAVRLAKHAAKVRIVDIVARTEIDETFTNDTDEELEGIFRFPLPPGAQIERLALEVDGKLVDGAFVDRDKGAAIWRGVIHNAAPKAPKPKEEIFWVPGPWRDPALLEWQRGGRFELKIFPIPKRGSRRVVLAYTELVPQASGVRRFTLPLAHDEGGTTKVGVFDLDLQVLGADKRIGVETRGYDLASATSEGGERRTLHADGFVSTGDLTVEYALPDRDKEVTAWAFAAASTAPAATVDSAQVRRAGKAPSAEQKEADAAAASIIDDPSPYVAIAIRPKLPRWKEAKERVHAIVVDASRSMVGERFARATHLAAAIVREMDRRDAFVLLACDTTCRTMGEGGAKPGAPGASGAQDVERFLGQIEPDGGSDLALAMSSARSAAGALGDKELRILYLGDGTPTVGPTKAGHLEAAVRSAVPGAQASVVAVPLGADADTTSLEALARGGGGVLVPYVPGQRVASAALDVLAAAYGEVLREPTVDLPSGLSQVTPSRLDPIRAGGETILVARMTGDVSGSLKLRGKVAGENFEQTYPLRVVSSTAAGNAFVPRLFAATKIAELDRDGGDSSKPAAIALSTRFNVASRFTSLLVLESETMFKAFGVDHNTSNGTSFTGEQEADSSSADGDLALADDDAPKDAAEKSAGDGHAGAHHAARAAATPQEGFLPGPTIRGGGKGSASQGRLGLDEEDARSAAPAAAPSAAAQATAAAPPPPPAKPADPSQNRFDSSGASVSEDKSAGKKKEANFATPASKQPSQPLGPTTLESRKAEREVDLRRRGFVPMRKVFDRKTSFDPLNTLAMQAGGKLVAAEAAFRATPDSRDRAVDLFAVYATTGRLGEAQEVTTKWAKRDALDPDALLARADLAARQGDRARAVRILGGLVDVRPNDRVAQTRLADLHDAAGESALACESRITLAELGSTEAKLVADAVRCTRAQGMSELASRLELDAGDKLRGPIDALLAATPPVRGLVGDVQLSAEWSGGEDLDLALVDAQGHRTSWLGTQVKGALVSARDVTNPGRETLAIANLPAGTYVIEITRAAGGDVGGLIRGEVTLRLGNETRKVPFNLTAARAEVGSVRVSFTSRLVPADQVNWRR